MPKSPSIFSVIGVQRRNSWSEYSKQELLQVGGKLQEIMLSPTCKDSLFQLSNSEVFDVFIPELIALKNVPQHKQNSKNALHHSILVVSNVPNNPVLKWSALLHDIGKIHYRVEVDGTLNFRGHEFSGAKLSKAILKRMKIKHSGDICRLIQFHSHPLDYQRQPNWKNATVKRFVDKYGHLSPLLVDLAIADKIASSGNSDYLEPLYTLRHMIEEVRYETHKE